LNAHYCRRVLSMCACIVDSWGRSFIFACGRTFECALL